MDISCASDRAKGPAYPAPCNLFTDAKFDTKREVGNGLWREWHGFPAALPLPHAPLQQRSASVAPDPADDPVLARQRLEDKRAAERDWRAAAGGLVAPALATPAAPALPVALAALLAGQRAVAQDDALAVAAFEAGFGAVLDSLPGRDHVNLAGVTRALMYAGLKPAVLSAGMRAIDLFIGDRSAPPLPHGYVDHHVGTRVCARLLADMLADTGLTDAQALQTAVHALCGRRASQPGALDLLARAACAASDHGRHKAGFLGLLDGVRYQLPGMRQVLSTFSPVSVLASVEFENAISYWLQNWRADGLPEALPSLLAQLWNTLDLGATQVMWRVVPTLRSLLCILREPALPAVQRDAIIDEMRQRAGSAHGVPGDLYALVIDIIDDAPTAFEARLPGAAMECYRWESTCRDVGELGWRLGHDPSLYRLARSVFGALMYKPRTDGAIDSGAALVRYVLNDFPVQMKDDLTPARHALVLKALHDARYPAQPCAPAPVQLLIDALLASDGVATVQHCGATLVALIDLFWTDDAAIARKQYLRLLPPLQSGAGAAQVRSSAGAAGLEAVPAQAADRARQIRAAAFEALGPARFFALLEREPGAGVKLFGKAASIGAWCGSAATLDRAIEALIAMPGNPSATFALDAISRLFEQARPLVSAGMVNRARDHFLRHWSAALKGAQGETDALDSDTKRGPAAPDVDDLVQRGVMALSGFYASLHVPAAKAYEHKGSSSPLLTRDFMRAQIAAIQAQQPDWAEPLTRPLRSLASVLPTPAAVPPTLVPPADASVPGDSPDRPDPKAQGDLS